MSEKQNRLLVPMNIEALLVGQSVEGSVWANLKRDFRAMNYQLGFLGQNLETEAFGSVQTLHDPGVHLHWALPDGLTHGSKESGEQLKFPPVPNRWLIVRLWDQGGPSRVDLQFKAWVLESDAITNDDASAPWPRSQAKNPNQYECVSVGKRFELGAWPGEPSSLAPEGRIKLTALGYGDPAFAAYYPACKTLLGFHDNDLGALANVTLAYFVAGWYSSPSQDDPLRQATAGVAKGKILEALEHFLEEKQWTYTELADILKKAKEAAAIKVDLKEHKEMVERLNPHAAEQDDVRKALTELQRQIVDLEGRRDTLAPELASLEESLPSEIICHGTIAGIRWEGEGKLYDSGVPRGEIKVCVGNTPVEALAALFKTELANSDLVRLLEAFQYDLLSELEKPGGDDGVQQKIHQRAFRPLARGIEWQVTEGVESRARHAAEEKSPPIPGDVLLLLENLNARQRLINRLKRERDSARSELYATWYTKVLNTKQKSLKDDTPLTRERTDWENEIDRLTLEIANLEDQQHGRPKRSEWDQLQASLKTFLPGYELQQREEIRFWRPNDPVVLLAGQPLQRSGRHGEDGRFRSDKRLLCRLSGQAITGIKITVPYAIKPEVEFGAVDLDAWGNPLSQGKPPLPEELIDLFREFLFLTLDEKRAQAIAHAAYEKNQPGLAQPGKVKPLSDDLLSWCAKVFKDDSSLPDLGDSQSSVSSGSFKLGGNHPAIPSPVGKNQWQKNPWLPLFLQWEVSWEPAYSAVSRAMEKWDLSSDGTVFQWGGKMGGSPAETYKGTTLLAPSASLNFSERLRQYNLTHQNQDLVKLQTAFHFINILCQNLGGFCDNLLTRRARLELRPLEPGKPPSLSPIFDKVKDVDWLSSLNSNRFYPVRAGHLKLEKLRVIDAFGQIYDRDGKAMDKVYRPTPLSGPDVHVRLEPRLSQPARLAIEWLPADKKRSNGIPREPGTGEFSPVCGWILPNFLDKAVMIYDAHGHALGSLQGVKRKSWELGVGGEHAEIEGFHWVGLPGSKSFYFGQPSAHIPDPLGATANPDLREFVRGLLSLTRQSGEAFAGLLDKMNEALSVAGGPGAAQNPNLALLIGRPLALVRASIALELDGSPARSENWDDWKKPAKDRTGGIENVKFPLRLGDRRKWKGLWLGEDGLVGFFQNSDYTRFFPAHGLTGRNDAYNEYSKVLEISVAAPLNLTLLLDPSRGVSATTGVLPRQLFHFPYGDLTETLENRHVIFYTGPVVSPRSAPENRPAPENPQIHMPHPSDVYGQWSWTHHPEVEVWDKAGITDTQKERGAFPEASLEIAEGWLKLATAPLAVRAFTIKGKNAVRKDVKEDGQDAQPDEFKVDRGEEIIISWAVIGADEVELLKGESSLFNSHRHPLPTQYAVRVDQDTSFTLVAAARADDLSEAKRETKTINVKLK